MRVDATSRATLRALAEQAAPGPWQTVHAALGYHDLVMRGTLAYALRGEGEMPRAAATAAYLAAVSPEVVLALLDALDQAHVALLATAPFRDMADRACWCRSLAAEDRHHSFVCVQAREALRAGVANGETDG